MKVTSRFSSNHFRFHIRSLFILWDKFSEALGIRRMRGQNVFRYSLSTPARTPLMPSDCSISIGDFIEQQLLLPTHQNHLYRSINGARHRTNKRRRCNYLHEVKSYCSLVRAASRLHTLSQKNINETHLQSIKSLINILLRTRNSFLGHHRSIE